MSRKLVCCLHSSNVSNNLPVKKFDSSKLQKCQEILLLRKDLNYKLADITLPDAVDDFNGYHSQCYKKFTSISLKKRKSANTEVSGEVPPCTSSQCSPPISNSNEEIDNAMTVCEEQVSDLRCVICGDGNTRQELNIAKSDTLTELMPYLSETQKAEVHRRVEQFIEINWHPNCRRKIKKNASSTLGFSESNWLHLRRAHERAFSDLVNHIEENILQRNECGVLATCYGQYMMNLDEILSDLDVAIGKFRSCHLRSKMENHFGSSIQWHSMFGNVVFCGEDYDLSNFTEQKLLENNKQEHAFQIRKEILRIPQKKLIDNVKLEDILIGDADLPKELIKFMNNIVIGPKKSVEISDKKERTIRSISSDIVYAVSDGRVKPAKHLQLGLALKNLCGSKKVVSIINHLGHCVSYNVAIELETELTYTVSKENILIPAEFNLNSQYATGLAFDNYDRFVETHNGRDTLHDTVGIIYQNIGKKNRLISDGGTTIGMLKQDFSLLFPLR